LPSVFELQEGNPSAAHNATHHEDNHDVKLRWQVAIEITVIIAACVIVLLIYAFARFA
jgi:hypothetical protein